MRLTKVTTADRPVVVDMSRIPSAFSSLAIATDR